MGGGIAEHVHTDDCYELPGTPAHKEIPAQKDWRRKLVMKALEDQGFDVKTLSAVSGRGGLLAPIRGRTWAGPAWASMTTW